MKIFITLFFFFNSLIFADTYPSKPIEFVVGLGEGGSADRMTREMTKFLENELDTQIKVKNMKKKASLEAANYVLNQTADGYTVFSSTFLPYLPNTILSGQAKYALDDFEIINLQWFDYDFIAVNKNSEFNSILQVLNHIKKYPNTISIAVINKSSGHLLLKLLLKNSDIPFKNIDIQVYNGGRAVREALFTQKADILITAAQGSEKYRDKIKALAISSERRSRRWDAPTLNEALKESNIKMPIINGPTRGFAVAKSFKVKYPKRFKILKNAIKRTLAKRRIQKHLKHRNIGYSWLGSKRSTEILNNSYELFKRYNYLLDN